MSASTSSLASFSCASLSNFARIACSKSESLILDALELVVVWPAGRFGSSHPIKTTLRPNNSGISQIYFFICLLFLLHDLSCAIYTNTQSICQPRECRDHCCFLRFLSRLIFLRRNFC